MNFGNAVNNHRMFPRRRKVCEKSGLCVANFKRAAAIVKGAYDKKANLVAKQGYETHYLSGDEQELVAKLLKLEDKSCLMSCPDPSLIDKKCLLAEMASVKIV